MATGLAWMVLFAILETDGSRPARLTGGRVGVGLPPQYGQCQAALDVGVDSTGSVTGVRRLYGDSLLTARLENAVARWIFEPAVERGTGGASRVLVAALVRPPALLNVGDSSPPPATLLAPAGMPIPILVRSPPYPPCALGSGLVIVEVAIGPSGDVRSARAMGKRTAFDDVATRAARAWRFLPGRRSGRPVPTVAYLVFGFQEPVLSEGPG